jgi:hypothetical protein
MAFARFGIIKVLKHALEVVFVDFPAKPEIFANSHLIFSFRRFLNANGFAECDDRFAAWV